MDKDSIDFMKGACLYSDMLSTVSPTYANELKTPYYGEHLEWVFQQRADSLHGPPPPPAGT